MISIPHGADNIEIMIKGNELAIVNTLPENISSGGYRYGLEIVQRISGYCHWRYNSEQTEERYIARLKFLN